MTVNIDDVLIGVGSTTTIVTENSVNCKNIR
jgi:hypothetical protein